MRRRMRREETGGGGDRRRRSSKFSIKLFVLIVSGSPEIMSVQPSFWEASCSNNIHNSS